MRPHSAGIDKKILLNYLRGPEAVQMIGHYFGAALDEAQARHVTSLLSPSTLQMTPAMLEQLCAEHETVDQMLAELDARCPPPPMLVPSR